MLHQRQLSVPVTNDQLHALKSVFHLIYTIVDFSDTHATSPAVSEYLTIVDPVTIRHCLHILERCHVVTVQHQALSV